MSLNCSFQNDYYKGAHPKVLQAIVDCNDDYDGGYGLDTYSDQARELLRTTMAAPEADIHFVVGGTQANLIISTLLKPYEAVITPVTGHTNIHESGAVEAAGHKIIAVETSDGKLTPALITETVEKFEDEHTVFPRAVFIANSTELGTVYSRTELEAIREVCTKRDLYLYLDGARLGQALVSETADLHLADVARLCDAFYIGGTKNGAIMGESLVLINPDFKNHFRNILKQRGALMAKGKFFGAQFAALFSDDLYLDLARHSQAMVTKLKEGITETGYSFLVETNTNQCFPILPNTVIQKLGEKYKFYTWKKVSPETSAVRLVTSWATEEADISAFLADLKNLSA